MSQIEMFAAEPPAKAIEHGGYHPASKPIYRGRQVPATYMESESMRVVQKPTLFWLLDSILDALYSGQIPRRGMDEALNVEVDSSTLSRHLDLLVSLELVNAERVYFGSESPEKGNYRGFQHIYSLPERGLHA